jgi:hypothetical protein
MNGAVFQTSAMIMTISASGDWPSHTMSVPRIEFTMPSVGSKIVCHMRAVTTVSTAHGTSTTVRSRPWPRKALCIASAIAIPRIVSSVTDAAVKMNVVLRASQNSESWKIAE